MNKPIRRVELVEGGNVVKQGEHFTLGFHLFDADGGLLTPVEDISVKIANRSGVVYETNGAMVNNRLEFSVTEDIGHGEMRVEITVSNASTVIQKYPADDWIRIKVTPSFDNLEYSGVNTITVTQLQNSLAKMQNDYKKVVDIKVAEISDKADSAIAKSTDAEGKSTDALGKSTNAIETSTAAKKLAESVKAEFDEVVAEAGSSNPEVVQARGGEASLKAALDKTTAQLAQTVTGVNGVKPVNGNVTISVPVIDTSTLATKTEVRLKTVKNELEDMSPTVLSAIQGGADTTFNLLSVPQTGSVTVEKTTFLKTGKNLFNKSTVTLGHYVSNVNGQLAIATGYNTSDFIPVSANTAYVRKQSNYIAYYDANKIFISGASASGLVFTTPANCYYIRVTMTTGGIETEQVELGANSTAYEPYGVLLKNDVTLQKESIPKEAISLEKTDFLNIQENLFDKNTIRTGGYYARNPSGYWATNSAYNSTDHIPVEANKVIKVNLSFNRGDICFYDKNKVAMNAYGILAGAWTDIITVPNDSLIKYVTIPLRIVEDLSKIVVADATNYPPFYIPYGKKLLAFKNNGLINGNSIINIPKTAGKNGLIFGDSITETAVVSDDGVTYTENSAWSSWVTYARDVLQLGQVWNYAKSGASYKNRNLEPRQYLGHQITTAIANNRPANIIVVAAGANDGISSLGSYETAMAKTTLESLDNTNLYESIRWAFWTLRKNYPTAVCFAATPIQRASNEPLTELNTAIVKMSNRYNFIVIDAANESGIVKDFEVDGATGRYLVDGLHPNAEGKKLMANLYSRVILNSYNY